MTDAATLTSLVEQFPELTPFDEHNRALADNVHPPNWHNPTPSGRYNLVVIGAGTAGLVTAAGAAGLGAKVALIERKLMGGDCLNVGCVPSKALIRAARVASQVRHASRFGVRVEGDVSVDFPAVMQQMRKLRAHISPNDSAARFRDLGIDVYIGGAQFTGHDTVEVAGQSLQFSKAVIATGARAAAPPIPGLNDIDYLTNENIFSLTELPRRLAVIGAGPIGCELAQSFARFGSDVVLIEAMHGIMPREDQQAAEIVKQSLLSDGVTLHCCGKNLKITPAGDAKRLVMDSHDEHYDLTVDQVLVAVGRAPNVEGLNLEKVNVEYNKMGVTVDDQLRTTNSRIFAAGDICSKYKFTHTADFYARIVIQNALFGFIPFVKGKASKLVVPWCTYTDPELAHVGMSLGDAKEAGIEVDEYVIHMNDVDRAILDGEDEGLLKVYTHKGKDKIVGATLVAGHAGELINELTLAITHGLGLGKIASTIHPYPTQADVIRKAGDAYNKTRLTPRTKKIFTKIMAWQR